LAIAKKFFFFKWNDYGEYSVFRSNKSAASINSSKGIASENGLNHAVRYQFVIFSIKWIGNN
jgi:hypothetical protein